MEDHGLHHCPTVSNCLRDAVMNPWLNPTLQCLLYLGLPCNLLSSDAACSQRSLYYNWLMSVIRLLQIATPIVFLCSQRSLYYRWLMSVIRRLQIATPIAFLWFSWNLDKWSMWPYSKKCGTDFQNFAFKIFGILFLFFCQIATPTFFL